MSAESKKGVISVQRCSVENQKGAIAIDFVHRGVGRLGEDKAFEGQAIVCGQWLAPPMFCLLTTFQRPCLYSKSALLVHNGTSLRSINTLVDLNWRDTCGQLSSGSDPWFYHCSASLLPENGIQPKIWQNVKEIEHFSFFKTIMIECSLKFMRKFIL